MEVMSMKEYPTLTKPLEIAVKQSVAVSCNRQDTSFEVISEYIVGDTVTVV